MFKRTAIISVVFIFMFAASFCVADEHRQGAKARRIEERLGQLHEMIEQGEVKLDRMRAEAGELEAMLRRESGDPDEGRRGEERQLAEAKERIVHLREAAAEAKEHGDIEKAKRLWAESKEIEHALEREMKGRDFRRHAEEVERKIHAMMGEAGELERAGKRDEANEIRRHAEKMARDLGEQHRRSAEAEFAQVKERIVHLRELAGQAKKEGEMEKATDLWEKSKHLEQELKREIEQRDARRHTQEIENKIHHMFAEAEELEAKGHEDEAYELRKKAERMVAEIHKSHQAMAEAHNRKVGEAGVEDEIEGMENEIRHLRDEVNELKEIVEVLRDRLPDR